MKRTAGLLLLFGFGLVAADFWQKPYMEWSDKDVAKMMNNSPWAKSASVSMSIAWGWPGPSDAAPWWWWRIRRWRPAGRRRVGIRTWRSGFGGPYSRCCGSMAISASHAAGVTTYRVRNRSGQIDRSQKASRTARYAL